MRRVILESPYAGDVDANLAYARQKLRQLVLRGDAPIASHLLLTQPGILDDNNKAERETGISAGLEWYSAADVIVFAAGRGWSPGMLRALGLAKAHEYKREVIDGEWP